MPPKSSVKPDKAFGMKNQKGAKAKRQIQTLKTQEHQTGKSKEALAKEKRKEEEKKMKAELEKQRAAELSLFQVTQPKVPFGVDPKTLTCAFWKAGKCDKGNKCKFGHSDDAGRKVQKKDLYTDMRDDPAGDKKTDTMDKWDQAKLDSVILSKHGNPKSTTDKVCKFFLEAVEDGKYGWFWECPNGGEKCMYKHRLPPGFVLKAQRKEQEAAEKANQITLEEFLEVQRKRLPSDKLTPVNADTFAIWKKQRQEKKAAEEELQKNKKATQAQANKLAGLSGKEMFTLNPELFGDDDEDGGDGGEFELSQYMKNWQQEREEEEKAEQVYGDEEDEERAGEGEGDVSATAQKVEKMSVNGDEGAEEGRRKE